jgi:hypothetical protein
VVRALFGLLGLTLVPALATASERQHHLGLAPVGSLVKVRNHNVSTGIGATALYTYGLTDQLNLMAEASHSFLGLGQGGDTPAPPLIRPGFLSTGAVGVSYVLDVLRWVPYAGILGSGNVMGGGTLPTAFFAPGAQVAAGLDYQFSRHLVAGVGFRQHFLLTKLKDYPSYSSLFVKIEWQWGY